MPKRKKLESYFLYRHRFGLGYTILFILFAALLFLLPLFSPNGLSTAEMESTITSVELSKESVVNGDVIDLPYHLLQKVSIHFLGLTPYAIKLPSILIGLFLGILLILLLNRWFKNNVALLASILTVLSTPFLYLVGSGTPLIMIVFWPTFLLWLGSKIQGEKRPRISYCFFFIFALIVSIFTPYSLYLAALIGLYVLAHPHLRFAVKNLPRIPFVFASLLGLAGVVFLVYNIIKIPTTGAALLFTSDFSFHNFFVNIRDGFLPFLSWSGNIESTLLSPMIGLATLVLALAGLISTAKGFFASRNSIASLLLFYTVLITGLNPDMAILLILPLAIFIAHGLRYIIDQWYGLFPENPYARFFGAIPITIFVGLIAISATLHFIYGYRYNPIVANEFNDDLALIYSEVPENTTFVIPAETFEYRFYRLLEGKSNYHVVSSFSEVDDGHFATLGLSDRADSKKLSRIITNSRSVSADRIYLYE